jgi:hypothetical protein
MPVAPLPRWSLTSRLAEALATREEVHLRPPDVLLIDRLLVAAYDVVNGTPGSIPDAMQRLDEILVEMEGHNG